MWKGAEDLGCEESNPCVGVKKFEEESRERYLLPEEMKAFFTALAEDEPLWRDYFLMCLFTGARKSNVLAMRWNELDLERGAWHLPGQQMKNKMPLVIVLAEPARVVLESRIYLREKTEWVFPANRRTKQGHIIDPYKPWARILKRAKLTGLRPHDLRRSLGSWQAAAGASLTIIGKTLGHRDHKSTQVYARVQLDPVRESVNGVTRDMQRAAGLLKDESDDGEIIDVDGKEAKS
ncbi:MAG: site-specific integrase [Planctomycetota bacterium]|nr:site-specific integrase [Planctomycetota bacterium]